MHARLVRFSFGPGKTAAAQEHADAAAAIIGPQLDNHLAGNVQGPSERRLFQVLSSA